MISPTEPYNELPPIPPSFVFDDVEILKKVNQANKALSELNGLIRTLENPEIILEPLKVKEAVESSGIENINTTISEALQAELFAADDLRPEQKETKNYKKALLLGNQKVKEKGFLTTNDYIEIQQMLGIEHGGIRNLPGTRIGNRTTGEVFYTPPEGEVLLRGLLANFEAYYNANERDPDYLVRMAVIHYQFEAIHPFFDGNGRCGRILMVLYLVLQGCLVTPALFLSQYINQNRSEYYRLLRGVTFRQEWKEWVLFILNATEQQAHKTNQTILQIIALRNRFRDAVLPPFNFTYAQEVLVYLFSNAFYTQSKLMKHTPIKSNKTASEYMNELQRAGVLKVAESLTREKVYYCEEFLQLLEQ